MFDLVVWKRAGAASHQVIKKQWKHWTWSLFGHVLHLYNGPLFFSIRGEGGLLLWRSWWWEVSSAHRGVGGSHAEVKNSRCFSGFFLLFFFLTHDRGAAIICTQNPDRKPRKNPPKEFPQPPSFLVSHKGRRRCLSRFILNAGHRLLSLSPATQIEFLCSILAWLLSNFFAYQIIAMGNNWSRERERTSLGVNVSIKGSTFGRENAFKSSLAETAVDFFLIRNKSKFSGRTRQTNGEKKIILNSSISKMVGNAGVERFKIVSVRTYIERSQEEFPIFTKITFPYYSVKSRPSGRDGGSNKRDIHWNWFRSEEEEEEEKDRKLNLIYTGVLPAYCETESTRC